MATDCWLDCDGNGTTRCEWCGGDGVFDDEIDDCGTTELVTCEECDGRGFHRCPGDLHDWTDDERADVRKGE